MVLTCFDIAFKLDRGHHLFRAMSRKAVVGALYETILWIPKVLIVGFALWLFNIAIYRIL
jgi:hypothetical protein